LSKLRIIFAIFAITLLFSFSAFAFTPNDEELTSSMQKHFGALTSWEAEMTFPEYPGSSVHIWYARGQWRQEWTAGDTAVAIGNKGSVVAKCTLENFALSPLFVWMPVNPVQTWKSWGVDNATRNFGFCDDSPCFMIGAEPGDDLAPVILLNNEDYSPILVRYASGNELVSVKYLDYRTLGGFRVPQRVIVGSDNNLLEANIKWVAVNKADSEELYARDALDVTPCVTPSIPFDIMRKLFRYPSVQ
jgi:hypothetical protein